MKIELAYGREGLEFEMPDQANPVVIRKPPFELPENPVQLIREALENPVGVPSLESLASQVSSACILICDITRPVPNGLFLRPLVEKLLDGGIALDQITVLVATGLHRPNLGEELEELVGDPWILEHIQVVNHDACNDDEHLMLGFTGKRRTPVGLDRRFVEADLKIATGLVEPHFMAGYSGGRKVIAPGIAHHSTIRTFHSARFMEDPLATSCNLEQNPLHEEQLEIVRMLQGPVLGLNTVIDEQRRLAYISFGEIFESHLNAVNFVRCKVEIPVGRKFRTIVTSAAGYPLDKTYYQTVKGMVTPLDILEEGGRLIIASECSEGIGSEAFRSAQKNLVEQGPDSFLEGLTQKKLADIDEWQTEMQLKPMRIGSIQLFTTGLNEEDRKITGVGQVSSITEAISASIAEQGSAEVAVIPEGPYLVPFVQPRNQTDPIEPSLH